MFKRFLGTNFVRDVLKLVASVGMGRLLLLAALPLATQLYSPQEFELLAVFMALVTTISVIACLRLDIAIPVAQSDDQAVHLLALALSCATGVALLLLTATSVAPTLWAGLIGAPEIGRHFWLVALGVFVAATYSALQFWAVRARRFTEIARTRASQAFVGTTCMLCLGWMGLSPLGLLFGTLLTVGGGGGYLLWQTLRRDQIALKSVTARGMRATFASFKRYASLSAPEALANIAGIQMPIVIIAASADGEAGQLFLAMQIMSAPIVVVGFSISQVYASRLPEAQADGTLASLTQQLLKGLAVMGVLPLCALGFLAPFVMVAIFGPDWELSGTIMALMVPWMVLQFLSSPISFVMMSTDRQLSMFALTVFGGLLRIAAVAYAVQNGFDLISIAYIASSATFYLICLLTYAHASGTLRRPDFGLMLLAVLALLAVYVTVLASLVLQ